MSQNKIPYRFIARRKELGYLPKDIADALGISPRTVRYWEAGRCEPNLVPAQSAILCGLLRCSIFELAGYFESVSKAA